VPLEICDFLFQTLNVLAQWFGRLRGGTTFKASSCGSTTSL
jgi:hypothetical protein